MRAAIVDNPATRQVEIYLIGHNESQAATYDDGLVWHPWEMGTQPPPFLKIEWEAWEAIIREVFGVSNPGEDAIKDARQVRDRLLTMIEVEWNSRQLEQK